MWAALDAAAERPRRSRSSTPPPASRPSFRELHQRVDGHRPWRCASRAQPGDRVAVLVPPGVDLIAVVYACWRIGAVTVVADRGLGLRGLGAAVRGARVDVVGPPRGHRRGAHPALGAGRVPHLAGPTPVLARWPRSTTSSARPPCCRRRRCPTTRPRWCSPPAPPARRRACATRHRPARARSATPLAAMYGITPDDRFVAAFAPFAVFGPALGIATELRRHGRHLARHAHRRRARRRVCVASTPPWCSPRRPRWPTWCARPPVPMPAFAGVRLGAVGRCAGARRRRCAPMAALCPRPRCTRPTA